MMNKFRKILSVPVYKISMITLMVSFFMIYWIIKKSNERFKNQILQTAIISASSLDRDQLNRLSGKQTDLNNKNYIFLKKQLIRLKKAIPNCRYIYILGQNENEELIFLINGSPMKELYDPANAPGEIYVDADQKYKDAQESKSVVMIDPVKDQFGNTVSALIPITLSNGKTLLFAVDVTVNDRTMFVLRNALSGILLILFLNIAIIIYSLMNQKSLVLADKKNLELTKFQRTLAFTLQSIDEGIIITDAEGSIIDMSQEAEKILGRKFSEISHYALNNVFILQAEDKNDPIPNIFNIIMETPSGHFSLNQCILFCKDKYAHISLSASRIYDGQKVLGVVLIFRDISEAVYFHKKLEESQYKLKTIVEKSPVFILTTDTSGIITFVDGSLIQKVNLKKEKLLGSNVKKIFQMNRQFEEEFLDATLGSENSLIITLANLYIKITLVPLFAGDNLVDGILIVGFDITENQQHQQSLQESEETFRALTENSDDTIMRFNKKFEHIYVNKSVEKLTGIPRYQFLGKRHDELGFPDYLCEVWENSINKVFNTAETLRVEFPLPNGIWIDWLLMPEFDQTGKVKAVITAARDISKQKQNEKNLEYFKQYFFDVINAMPSMIIGISDEGKINIWNNEMANFTQKSAKSVINSDVKEFLKMFDLSWNHVQKALDNNEKVEISKKEILLDEKWRTKNIIIFPLKTGNHRQAIIRIDDITHQVHLEKVLIQSEKMIALGSLALGMAHEINNPITGVIHNIDVLTNRLTRNLPKNRAIAEAHGFDMKSLHQYVQDRKIDKLLELMRSSGQRAAEITISMLNFSRKGNIQKGYYNLKEILLEVLKDLKKNKPSNFTPLLNQLIIKMSAPDFDVEVYCNKGQLFEVLISVIKNSLESIDDKTNLPKIDINLQQTKTHLKLFVSDNGAGIKKENRKYVFDPFYTTKSPKKGIGLGLAISYYIIVHNHGGEMYVDDSFDKGTKLVIKLPISGDI